MGNCFEGVFGGAATAEPPPEQHDNRHLQQKGHLKFKTAALAVTDWRRSVKAAAKKPLFEEHQTLLKAAGLTYETLNTKFTARDALLIIDMQNDFLPAEDCADGDGGRFAVAEGASAGTVILDLIKKAADGGAKIIATRDYHPKGHCSFNTNKGPFPPHCLQGTKGSHIWEPIRQALSKVRAAGSDVDVVFKGFVNECDSFGGLRYGQEYYEARHLGNECGAVNPCTKIHGCSAVQWTGCFCLECTNLEEDLNAPPDVMAVFSRQTLADKLKDKGIQRVFVVGLAMDFCVLDTALNGASANVVSEIYMPVEAMRAAYIPGIGTFGSGFLSDPQEIVNKASLAGVKLCHVDGIR